MSFKTSTAVYFILTALSGTSALALTQQAHALDDGLKVELSASEVEDLKRWTENAKTKIDILLDDIRYYSLSEKREALLTGFRSIAQQSVNKDNELLMAIVLRRAVRVSEIVGNTSQESELQSLVSLLETSAQKAQTFYVDDQAYLNAIANRVAPKTLKDMSAFGYEYASYVLSLAPTFLNPKTEYVLTRTAIGWFGNDLNSSRNALNRPLFSDEILRVSALLEQYPAEAPSSADSLRKSIRNLKFQIRERVLQGAFKKVKDLTGKAPSDSLRAKKKSDKGVTFDLVETKDGRNVWRDTITDLTWYPVFYGEYSHPLNQIEAERVCNTNGLRLPTPQEFINGELHGIRSMFDDWGNMDFWSTIEVEKRTLFYWYFKSSTGQIHVKTTGISENLVFDASVRCVK